MGGIGNFRRKMSAEHGGGKGKKKNAAAFALAVLRSGNVHVHELQSVRVGGSNAIQGDALKMRALMHAAGRQLKFQARKREEEKAVGAAVDTHADNKQQK